MLCFHFFFSNHWGNNIFSSLLSVTQFESFKTYNMIPYTDNLSKIWSKLTCTRALLYTCFKKNLVFRLFKMAFISTVGRYIKFPRLTEECRKILIQKIIFFFSFSCFTLFYVVMKFQFLLIVTSKITSKYC